MIVDELNEAYETFMAKHPDFNGKITVFALSLGGIAMYDILTCQDDDDVEDGKGEEDEAQQEHTKPEDVDSTHHANPEQKSESSGSTKSPKPKVRKQDQAKYKSVIPKLKFRPNYLFTVGSPIGIANNTGSEPLRCTEKLYKSLIIIDTLSIAF
jgi:hypothetical protein